MRVTKLVRRSFPILAVVAGLSLLMGLIVPNEGTRTVRWLEFVAIVWAHCFAAIYLGSTEQWVATMAIEGSLPDWAGAQAEKNRRKSALCVVPGLLMYCILAMSRAKGWVVGTWWIGLQAFNLAFQVGAFLGESAIIAAQAKFVGIFEDRVSSRGVDLADNAT